jgi:hypothetical protein
MSEDDVLQADAAERAVLGALLIDPTLIQSVGDLPASDFYRPHHETIYAAIREAVDSGDRVCQLVVMEVLKRRGQLTTVGGAAYLHELERCTPSVGSAGYYARLVKTAATRRTLLQHAVALRQACLSVDLEDALDRAAEISISINAVADGIPAKGDDPMTGLHELGEFAAQATDYSHDWVIPGLLERMDRVVVVASEGGGKTTWARAVATMLGQGIHPLNPNLRIPAKRALIVDLENPPALIRRKARHLVDAAAASQVGGWTTDRVWLWSRPGGLNLRKASDAALLDRVVSHVRPALICLGPLYKAAQGGGDRGEQVASETAAALDRIREKHGCALWLEHHAPMSQQGERMLRPVESGVWSRWPEFGITIRKVGEPTQKRFELGRFRGDRDERCWPDEMTWGARWPFDFKWNDGMPGGLHDGQWGAA